MKKIILTSIAIWAIAIVAAINLSLNTRSKNSYKISRANMEALANGEGSNNSGTGNIYYYEHRLGEPKTCTLHKGVDANGNVQYGSDGGSFGAGWSVVKVSGMVESCPGTGNGCTVYSCHETNNTN
ncbi:MAG: NVEALA domain-containing protein [Tannerella sp.]|jgi:hypothetical protein|nr:NVEALA domain-containing protein [Tannerella sp.]